MPRMAFCRAWPTLVLQGRYGIKHFHHPELVANIVMANREGYLLHLLDVLFFPNVDAKTLPFK